MNYILKPSLEHITLVKIAVMMWNLSDIRALIEKFYFALYICQNLIKWQEIEERVIENVHKLPQPTYLQEKVLGLIKPIGLQILQWIEYHYENFLEANLPNEFCWTSQGIMDTKKTVDVLIKDESIDITVRYHLACTYCLDNDILKLWNEIPEDRRNFFYRELDSAHFVQNELVALWTDKIKGETARRNDVNHRSSPYQYIFETSAKCGNKAAVEYFVRKLTASEKKESMVRVAECVAKRRNYCDTVFSNILCFLFSHMDEEQQINVFKSHSFYVLKCLLDWPWQRFFLETANHMWNFLPGYSYNRSLKVIISKIAEGYKDFDYQNIFEKFWKQSPSTLKRHITDDNRSIANILYRLLQIKDEKSFKMIIQDASLESKNKLIFSKRGRYICDEMIYCEEHVLLEFFIRECIPSKDEMVQFKAEFKEHITLRLSKNELPKNKERWDKFFYFLDNLVY